MNRFCSLALVLLVACGDGGGTDETPLDGPAYVLGTLVFGPEGTASYVSVLDGLGSSTVDLKQAREFPSAADVWVHGGKVFVTNPEALTLTRYRLEGHALAEEATISFASYGLTSFGFWLNSFVADDKAYLLNGAAEFIVWNPEARSARRGRPRTGRPLRAGSVYRSGSAAPIDAFDWNAGAQYSFDIDNQTYMLVATGDYSSTRIFDLGRDGTATTQAFESPGWSVRLFRAR